MFLITENVLFVLQSEAHWKWS